MVDIKDKHKAKDLVSEIFPSYSEWDTVKCQSNLIRNDFIIQSNHDTLAHRDFNFQLRVF